MDTQHQQRAYIGKGRKSGLYAYELLDTIKNESKGHIKSLALDKELKNLNYYLKVKNMTSEEPSAEVEDEEAKQRRQVELDKYRRAKAHRNEVELMYRSSKLNEEKVNILKSASSSEDLSIVNNASIINYLPPMLMLEHGMTHATATNKIGQLAIESGERSAATRQYGASMTATATGTGTRREERHLVFLTEKPTADDELTADTTQSIDTLDKSSRSHHHQQQQQQQQQQQRHHNTVNVTFRDQVATQEASIEKIAVCPPLSLNALMEYKPLITANGHGEFKHGKPTFFRP